MRPTVLPTRTAFQNVTRASRLALPSGLLCLLALLAACGGKQSPQATPKPYEIDTEEEDDGGMEMMQEFGGMSEEKVNKTVERLYPSLSDCLMKGFERVDFLGGEVAFLVKVNRAGRAEVAHAESSTLGDYESEQCMLDTLEASRWPKPVGGKIGLARTSIAFDPPGDVRPPVRWTFDDIQEAVENHRPALRECGPGGPFEITVYVDTSGQVMTAGISHTDDTGASAASCLIETVEEMEFGSPGSWPAKVTFSL